MDSLEKSYMDTYRDSSENANLVYLHPNNEKCLGRVPSLSKVDGLESNEVEVLNNWFLDNWKKIYSSGFIMNDSLTQDFTDYLQRKSPILVDLEKVESYLSVQKLLYNGLRLELRDEKGENVSQCKLFHKYYYSCRENPVSLNNLVVLSNVIWSLKKYVKDEFALTCLVDILLQSYMVALNSFISLGGVAVLRETLEYLAQNEKLKQSTNFLLKCMDLLDKLDINFRVLQTSRIGVPVNCIAQGKSHAKLKLDYECSNDKVKLKATNLIKKWKAIRDASLPTKANAEHENKIKKAQMPEGRMLSKKSIESTTDKRGEKGQSEKRLREKRETEKGSQGEGTNNEQEGSFVLNIINTMVEQKEKEKKRKMEIRNSQMSTKYKGTTTSTNNKGKMDKEYKGERSGSGENGLSGLGGRSKTGADKMKEGERKGPGGQGEGEKDKSSTTQLASLMNFFKEYSNKTEERAEEATATATATEVNHQHHAGAAGHQFGTGTAASALLHHAVTDAALKQQHYQQQTGQAAQSRHMATSTASVSGQPAPALSTSAAASVATATATATATVTAAGSATATSANASASANANVNAVNLTGQPASSAEQQLGSKYESHQIGPATMIAHQLGHGVGGIQQLGGVYGTYQYAHSMPIQVAGGGHNLQQHGVNVQTHGASLQQHVGFSDVPPAVAQNGRKRLGFTDGPPVGFSDGPQQLGHNVGGQVAHNVGGQVAHNVGQQVLQQVQPPAPPPPPPPMSNVKHGQQQYAMNTNKMQQQYEITNKMQQQYEITNKMQHQLSGASKHVTGGFTNAMDASSEQLGYIKKEYRNRGQEQTSVYGSYGVYGNVMTPGGYAPPPPPPPAPPGPTHYQGATQENTGAYEGQKSRFSPPRNKFQQVQVNFHGQGQSYEDGGQENYVDDKNIEFYHTGAESTKEEGRQQVVPPWK